MISRIVLLTVQPGRIREFRTSLNEEFIPKIQTQAGFIENIESLDPNTGKFCCITLWQTPADEERYGKGLFQEMSRKLAPILAASMTVNTLPVENASAHKIHAGKAGMGQNKKLAA